jgi:hypothetical protein
MRLDRYIGDATGKFSIIENKKGGKITHIHDPVDDFIVLKLKDANTSLALRAYAASARKFGDDELADDMERLAQEAEDHPLRRAPD